MAQYIHIRPFKRDELISGSRYKFTESIGYSVLCELLNVFRKIRLTKRSQKVKSYQLGIYEVQMCWICHFIGAYGLYIYLAVLIKCTNIK